MVINNKEICPISILIKLWKERLNIIKERVPSYPCQVIKFGHQSSVCRCM